MPTTARDNRKLGTLDGIADTANAGNIAADGSALDATERVRQQVRSFPLQSGVYIMKNSGGTIIYIGKAQTLRSRVLSYFRENNHPKTKALMRHVATIEYVVTDNNYQALLLEINLIKQWMPKYNIDLKDGKSYPLIKVTAEKFPRIVKTREIVRDGSRYYGPYIHVHKLGTLLETIHTLFPLRKCRGALKTREHPCLHYHIGRCAAPCAQKIDHKQYLERIAFIEEILKGNTKDIKTYLHLQIESAIKEERFEDASKYRDAFQTIGMMEQQQQISTVADGRVDYVDYAETVHRAMIILFQTVNGTMVGSHRFVVDGAPDVEEQLMHVVVQFYDNASTFPQQLVVPRYSPQWKLVADYFANDKKQPIRICGASGERDHKLMRLVNRNARVALHTMRDTDASAKEALEELQELLQLPEPPHHIEGVDIAHMKGSHMVGSLVCFLNGKPAKSRYRKYNIRSVDYIDDYEAIREVVARRFTRIINEQQEAPSLLLIDGGLGQVNAAAGILKSLKITGVSLLGIAKEHELLYAPHTSTPLSLPHDTRALQLLVRVRDESHRFATAHRAQKQTKAMKTTLLQQVAGIGPKRERLLLQQFGTIQGIMQAGAEAIATVCHLDPVQAEKIVEHLRKSSSKIGKTG